MCRSGVPFSTQTNLRFHCRYGSWELLSATVIALAHLLPHSLSWPSNVPLPMCTCISKVRIRLLQLSLSWCCCVLRPWTSFPGCSSNGCWEWDPKLDAQNNTVSSGMCNHRTVALSLGSMPLLWLTWESKLFGPWGANWMWSWQYNPIWGGENVVWAKFRSWVWNLPTKS